jgi:hypothetical protein
MKLLATTLGTFLAAIVIVAAANGIRPSREDVVGKTAALSTPLLTANTEIAHVKVTRAWADLPIRNERTPVATKAVGPVEAPFSFASTIPDAPSLASEQKATLRSIALRKIIRRPTLQIAKAVRSDRGIRRFAIQTRPQRIRVRPRPSAPTDQSIIALNSAPIQEEPIEFRLASR